mmetsp:Transcript_91678/g.213204  ORF Transcript_91678/g.213204 Transcript_91678/m.213204 type:complete len:207 (+) Transcript_91678:1067-1687(+)
MARHRITAARAGEEQLLLSLLHRAVLGPCSGAKSEDSYQGAMLELLQQPPSLVVVVLVVALRVVVVLVVVANASSRNPAAHGRFACGLSESPKTKRPSSSSARTVVVPSSVMPLLWSAVARSHGPEIKRGPGTSMSRLSSSPVSPWYWPWLLPVSGLLRQGRRAAACRQRRQRELAVWTISVPSRVLAVRCSVATAAAAPKSDQPR